MTLKQGLQEKCCLILGGTSGLGNAIAEKFAAEGFDLILTTKKLTDHHSNINHTIAKKYNVSMQWIEYDAMDPKENKGFLSSLPSFPGVVVCAIGSMGNQKPEDADVQEINTINQINYLGPATIINEIARYMASHNTGCIIGISSPAGNRGRKTNYFYGASKAAFTTFLSGLRQRLYSSGVHVITVIPGYMYTNMTAGMHFPKYLTTTPKELANSVWKAYRNKHNYVYSSFLWRLILWVVSIIPESIFKKLDF